MAQDKSFLKIVFLKLFKVDYNQNVDQQDVGWTNVQSNSQKQHCFRTCLFALSNTSVIEIIFHR